jgi:hypothetical protein
MDAAIHFYGQLGVHAESVEDVLPEWMLSAEFQAGKPSVAQRCPQTGLCLCRGIPLISRRTD